MDVSKKQILDLSLYGIATASMYWKIPSKTRLIDGCFHGVQSFAIVSIFDKFLRCLLERNVKAEPILVRQTVVSAIAEGAMYSGVLLTQSKKWMILRFAAALFTGMTAARSLTGRVTPEQNKQGFTLDTKIGFLWALFREALLFTISSPALSASLIVADSCISALAEVCPTEGKPDLPKFTSAWNYKVLFSIFFRCIANKVAETHGVTAAIVQQALYNLSNAFPEKHPVQQDTHLQEI